MLIQRELSDPRDIVPAALAAAYAKVRPATLRSWVHRPSTGVNRYPGGYSVDEIDAFLARRNTRMIRRRPAKATPCL